MDWSVSRISMPVFDLEKSRQFYNFLFNNDNEDYSKNIIKSDECIIYGGDIELRLYKLKAELKSVDKLQSRRTFPTICIKNLDLAVKNLEKTVEEQNQRINSMEENCDEFYKNIEELESLIEELEPDISEVEYPKGK